MSSLDQGWTALQDGHVAAASGVFSRASIADPASSEAWIGLAHARRAAGDWPGVAEALDGVVRHVRDRAVVHAAAIARGHVLDSRIADLASARKAYEGALQVDPNQVWPYLALAELDLRSGQWNRALAYATHGLESASPLAPERPWLLLCRAIGRRRSSLSMGPVSMFFRGLAPEPSEGPLPVPSKPGDEDVALALKALPRLRALLPGDPLSDAAALARVVQAEMPRPGLPSPR